MAILGDGVKKLFETWSPEVGAIRVERWPEGYVFWAGGEIKWKSWVGAGYDHKTDWPGTRR